MQTIVPTDWVLQDQEEADLYVRRRSDREICWQFPIAWLATAEHDADELFVTLEAGGEWRALTERDQCVKRDLDREEIQRFLDETGLAHFAPRALLAAPDTGLEL